MPLRAIIDQIDLDAVDRPARSIGDHWADEKETAAAAAEWRDGKDDASRASSVSLAMEQPP